MKSANTGRALPLLLLLLVVGLGVAALLVFQFQSRQSLALEQVQAQRLAEEARIPGAISPSAAVEAPIHAPETDARTNAAQSADFDRQQQGPVLVLGADLSVNGKQAARLADQILDGANVANLPIEIGETYISIDLWIAEQSKLTVSEAILAQADQIVRTQDAS